MPRTQLPEGYISSQEAVNILGQNRTTLSRYVKKGLLHQYGPEHRKYKYYKKSEVDALAQAEKAFYESGVESHVSSDAVFSPATHGDMDALYTMAVKLFPRTASAAHRRSWMTKEPRGHYVVRRKADGAVVAYFYILALHHDVIVKYLHREVRNNNIMPDDVLNFVPGVPVEIILGGIASDPDVPEDIRSSYVSVLLRGVRHDLERLGHEGITISRMYAFSETESGIAMCARLGMSQWEPPVGKFCTFQMEIAESNTPIMRGYKQGLAEWRATHVVHIPQRSTTKSRAASTTSAQNALPGDVPEGTMLLFKFAELHGVDRRKLLDQVQSHKLAHIAIPKQNRPSETDRYFTPDQQQAVLEFWEQKGIPYQ